MATEVQNGLLIWQNAPNALQYMQSSARRRPTDRRRFASVEMEALTAVAALAICDMAQAVQRTTEIGNVRLLAKRGRPVGRMAAGDDVKITVKLFASVRQRLGRSTLEMELPAGATVADVQERLQAEYPQLGLDSGGVFIAVNLRYAQPDRVLREGDEVALMPPVGGG